MKKKIITMALSLLILNGCTSVPVIHTADNEVDYPLIMKPLEKDGRWFIKTRDGVSLELLNVKNVAYLKDHEVFVHSESLSSCTFDATLAIIDTSWKKKDTNWLSHDLFKRMDWNKNIATEKITVKRC